MIDFSISRIMFINSLFSIPLFLIYKLSKNINYTILVLTFIITYSIELYFQKFLTKTIHLITYFCILLFMLSYIYQKYNIIEISNIFLIAIMILLSLYYLLSILRFNNNYTLSNGYLIFTSISFLYFSSLPGLLDTT